MAISVKEIKEKVDIFIDGEDSESFFDQKTLNSTQEFKKIYKQRNLELKEVLSNEELTSVELISKLDELAQTILNYRYQIVDYGHYTDDVDEHRSHLYLNTKDY